MATLRKRRRKGGGFIYWVDFYFNGQRYVKSTKTGDFQTAKRIQKEIEARIARNTFTLDQIKAKKEVHLKKFIIHLLDYSHTHKSDKTYAADKLALNNFLDFAGNVSLDHIDRQMIDQYMNHRIKTVKKSSANVDIRHMKAAFTKAVEWGYIDKNPFRGVRQFTLRKSAPLFFTRGEIRKLLFAIEEEWLKHIVIFALNTGVRIGELVNVEWTDLDFENRTIRIGHKDTFTTKSGKERSVPMSDEAFQLLIHLKQESSYIFPNAAGNRRDSVHVSRKFKQYIRQLGFNEKYSFHTLRHTFASHLVQQGESIYIVSKLLGHSDVKITEIYSHLAPETYVDVVNKLDFQKNRHMPDMDSTNGKTGMKKR